MEKWKNGIMGKYNNEVMIALNLLPFAFNPTG
jgi:hypothetical protein